MFCLIGRQPWPSPVLKSYLTRTKGAPFLSRTLRQGWEAKLSLRKCPALQVRRGGFC